MNAITTRQRDVAALVAQGRTNLEIASELTVSLDTVKTHIVAVIRRLGARNRTHLAAIYTRHLATGEPLPNGVTVPTSHSRSIYAPHRIVEYRKAAGFTRNQLARRVYCSIGAIGDYQAGRSQPSPATLALLADALGVSVGDFYIQQSVELKEAA